jgi:hypothetical protein
MSKLCQDKKRLFSKGFPATITRLADVEGHFEQLWSLDAGDGQPK